MRVKAWRETVGSQLLLPCRSKHDRCILKFRRVTIRGAQPSARLSEEICLSEGSAGVSQRALRGLSGVSPRVLRGSAGVRGIFQGFSGVVTLCLWPSGTVGLPAHRGAFYLQLCLGAFWLTALASLLTVELLCLQWESACNKHLKRSSTVSKKAPKASGTVGMQPPVDLSDKACFETEESERQGEFDGRRWPRDGAVKLGLCKSKTSIIERLAMECTNRKETKSIGQREAITEKSISSFEPDFRWIFGQY